MQINYSPRMTALLVDAQAFASEPFTLVDVGAMGGIQGEWAVFGKDLRVFAFEPNEEECARLQKTADPRIRYLPYALGARDETRTLYVHRNPSSSTIFPYPKNFAEQFTWHRNAECVAEVPIMLRRMDDVLAGMGNVDFVKLDAEGAELDIMDGGRGIFSRKDMLGVKTEIRFHGGFGTPLFWEVDKKMREFGYELYDIEKWASSRRALPYPHLYDVPHDVNAGERVFGATIGGQILTGDALYLRAGLRADLEITKILKLACLLEIFEQVDSAAALILAHAGAVDRVIDHRRLLDALVPPAHGHSLSYADHVRRYYEWDPIFRPETPGKRYPDRLLESYDGTFVPQWDFNLLTLTKLALIARIYPSLKRAVRAAMRMVRWTSNAFMAVFVRRWLRSVASMLIPNPAKRLLRKIAGAYLPSPVKRWLHSRLGV